MIARLLVAALAGAAVMALEVLSSRWLAPAFGFTLSTWAVLISVTLFAGSVGAGLGGLWSGARGLARTRLALTVAGVWTAGVAFASPYVAASMLDLDLLVGSIGLAFVILFVPVVLLASLVPMLVDGTRTGSAGRTVGWLVMASTFGSLVGTLTTALVLVPSIGLQWTAIGWAGALVLAAALLGASRTPGVLVLSVAVGAALFTHDPGAGAAYERETPYGRLVIREAGDGLVLTVNGINQAGVSPLVSGRGALIASRHYVELLPWLRPQGRRALNVGLGGGLVPTALEAYGVGTVSLEINPGLAAVVRDRFGFDGDVRIGDGRASWRRMDERFDFVVLDAFQGEGLPAHLLTREAFQELAQRLTPRGVICVHLIGTPHHRVTEAVIATLDAVWDRVLAVRSGLRDELQDMFLFASDRPLVVPPAPELIEAGWIGNEIFVARGSGRVLTDDDTPLDVWNEPLARALRRASRRGPARPARGR